MAGFSEGPWIPVEHKGRWTVLQVHADTHGRRGTRLATLPNSLDRLGGETPANARLMAAAPDLLVALEGLYRLVSDTPGFLTDQRGWGVAMAAAITAMEDARGRQPATELAKNRRRPGS